MAIIRDQGRWLSGGSIDPMIVPITEYVIALIMLRFCVVLLCLLSATGCASRQSLQEQTDSFLDSRDGQRYPVITLGGQAWMGRNLAFAAEPSWCYEDRDDNCETKGRLYPWEVAVNACPEGWHLPSDEEWIDLEAFLGMAKEELPRTRFRGTNQGARLREGGDTGFAAPISGYRRPDGSYARWGERSAYWLSTEADSAAAWHRDIRSDEGRIYRSAVPKGYALSVRCLRN